MRGLRLTALCFRHAVCPPTPPHRTYTGGQYTGYSSLNPARTLATSLIFGCYWRYAGVYLLAQLLGLTAASLLALAVYGRGPHYTGA